LDEPPNACIGRPSRKQGQLLARELRPHGLPSRSLFAPGVTHLRSQLKKGPISASIFKAAAPFPPGSSVANTLLPYTERENDMPESIYDVITLTGTSNVSWEKAAANAVKEASKTLRDLRVAEIVELDMQLNAKGKVEAYRAKVRLSFKVDR
jgi:flavin-binding protein dodecin